MPTLKDIADRAKVNVSTVSRALNGNSDISDETRKLIFSIADELNYNYSCKRKSTHLIGVLVPEFISGYFSSMISHIEQFLRENNYLPVFHVSNFEQNREMNGIDLFCQKNVDGIFLLCPMYKKTTIAIHKAWNNYQIPTVLLESLIHLPEYNYIMIDDSYGMELALRHLLDRGHTKIGFITDNFNKQYRYQLFERAMKNCQLEINPAYTAFSNNRFEQGGYEAMQEIIAKPDRPTALLTGYDSIAIGAMRAIYEKKMSIPEDFSIIGNDNIRESAYLSKSLTTISPPLREMTKLGVRLLLDMIENPENTVVHNVLLKPELIIRETT